MTDTTALQPDPKTDDGGYAEHYDEHAVRRRDVMEDFNHALAEVFNGVLALREQANRLQLDGDCCEHEDWLYYADASVLDRHLATAQDAVATAQAIHRPFPKAAR